MICLLQDAKSTVLNNLLIVSKEQALSLSGKTVGIQLKLNCGDNLSGVMDILKFCLNFKSFESKRNDFAESVGRVTAESIKFYIERQQDKHWEHKDYEEVIFERNDLINGQTKIQDFMF